ncbi:MAG: hypothetical protein FJX75_08015 [Armatimonadetes bacterium]|nr:hypothetical protein [Armatimonadota bacterium]
MCGRLCVLAVVVWPCHDVFPQNLLDNPSFEEIDAAGAAVGWTPNGGATLVAEEGVARKGAHAVKVRFDDRFAQARPVEGGETYRFRGFVRRVEPGGDEVPKIKVYFLDAQGQRVDVQASEFPGVTADTYLAFEAVMRAPETAATLNLTLCGMFEGKEWFYYDDLSLEHIKARDWPLWEGTPDLNGVTVTVADIADVWTDALLRIPPYSIVPIDGRLDTSLETRGKDLRIVLARPCELNYLLVHTMKPLQALGEAAFVPAKGAEPFLRTKPQDTLIASHRFRDRKLSEFRIDLLDDAVVCLSEVQAFGLAEKEWQPPGEPVTMRFVQQEPSAETAAHLERAFPRPEDRTARVAAVTDQAQAATETLPAKRTLNLLTTPGPEAYGVSVLELSLPVTSQDPEAMLEIRLKQPCELDCDLTHGSQAVEGSNVLGHLAPERRKYSDLFRIVTRVGSRQPLTVQFDIPDTLFSPGEPLWIALRPSAEMTLDLPSATMTAYTIPPELALAEYLSRLERVARRMYSYETEAHVYDGRDYKPMLLNQYVQRVLQLDPGNQPATLILNRIARRKAPVELTRPGPAEAPDWAVWERLALQNMHELILWWLDNRQQGDGQLAGHINDDGEFSCNWPSDYLITGDQRVLECLRKLADVAWEMSGGKGYTVGSHDVEHAAEDQSCTQPQLVICDYGAPKPLERMMVMSRYLDFWTAINSVGRRQFKSYMFTSDRIWGDPPNDIDHAYCPLAMVGAGHLVWYAGIPDLRKLFLEEADSWAAACMSTDKGKAKGVIPHEIRFSNSEILPYTPYDRTNPILQGRNDLYMGSAGQYIVRYLLEGATMLTGDPKFAEPLHVSDPTPEQIVKRAEDTLKAYGVADLSDKSWSADQNETRLYDAWKVTGDKRWLVEEFKECIRQQERTRWLLTEAEPFTDRIGYAGRTLLSMTYLGGFTSGKSHVPGHWVSWEGGGTDFSALVLEAKRDHLKALVYSFADQPRDMKLRVWALPHGRYSVTTGLDTNADDEPDASVKHQTLELARYDAVPFITPPGKTVVLDLRLTEELDPITSRPDLALGPEDVRYENGTLTVTIHNVGATPSPQTTLQVQDTRGKVLAEAEVPAMEAPLDLKPRTAEVTVRVRPTGEWRVVLDPKDEVREVTEVNNGARLDPWTPAPRGTAPRP